MTRTCDPVINSHLLCQLSYWGMAGRESREAPPPRQEVVRGPAPQAARLYYAVILAGFEHRPGVHSGSTALADALRARGVAISEPMAFGLGAGLGFYYLVAPALSPTHLIVGRTLHLERTACEVLGAPLPYRTEDDPARAWEGVQAALHRGLAPILATDLAELPYWNTRTRFGGHRVVLAGYDAERGVALVADGDRPGLEEVPLEALGARGSPWRRRSGRPGARGSRWTRPPPRAPIEEAVRDALRRQARDFLLDVDGAAGISALERFAAELQEWPSRASGEADRAWCFRLRLPGHREARRGRRHLPRPVRARSWRRRRGASQRSGPGPVARMRALAEAWTRLAEMMRAISDVPGGLVPPQVREHVRGDRPRRAAVPRGRRGAGPVIR